MIRITAILTLFLHSLLFCNAQEYFYFKTNEFFGYEGGALTGTLWRTDPSNFYFSNDVYIVLRTNVSGVTPANPITNELSGVVVHTGGVPTAQVNFPAGAQSAPFSLTVVQNGSAQTDRGVLLDVAPPYGNPAPSNYIQQAIGYLQDNDNPITIVTNAVPTIREGRTNSFTFQRATNNSYGPVTVRFQMEGTATRTNDYDLFADTASGFSLAFGSTNQFTMPPGWIIGSLMIVAKNDALVEGDETAVVRLRQNTAQYVLPSVTSNLMHIVDDYAMVEVDAVDSFARETGDTGTFRISRSGPTNVSLTINYTVGGTATSGSDYTALPASVTLAAGVSSTNLTVTPLAGGGTENAETVVLNLSTNVAYLLGMATNAVVTIGSEFPHPRDALPQTEYYARGTGSNLAVYSYVIPLDGIKGTRRADMETNGATLLYHYNGSNTANQAYASNRLAFDTPVVSFGRSWGTTLYAGETHGFTIYAGNPSPAYAAMNVVAYYRSNGAVAGTTPLTLPNPTLSNDWSGFTSNGFARAVSAFGLTTRLHASPTLFLGEYTLTHSASAESSNYFYRVEFKGLASALGMVINSAGTHVHSPLYEIQFDQRPQHQSILLRRPHFQSDPLPPFFWNKTPEELQSFGAAVTNAVALTPSSCTNVDQSPELRRHPILDQFVADLNGDPIALANYVLNEIDLIDPIAYRDDGAIETESLNAGGVNRGALGVYLEGQGSPVEQCALLVYLLRQANYPATYVFPTEGGLKLLDTRVSQLLKTRINGAQDEENRLYTTNRLITVNYPWVAVYLTNESRWVHVFPWLKDVSLVEGFDLWDFLPNENKVLYSWVRDYVLARTNVMSFASADDDSAGYIFPRYLNQFLETNAPGISIDDIGVRAINRRHLYSRWDDFPRPTWVTNASTTVESLTSTAITNVSPRLTNIFDTVAVELFSVNNPQKKIATGELRTADLHNRKFFLTHTNSGTTQHRAVLTLAPYRPSATNTLGSFAASDTTLTNRQVLVLALDDTDDALRLRLRHRRQKALAWEQALDSERSFLGLSASREILDERPLRKGDVAAICTTVGRVTPAMLSTHAQELWTIERQLATNSGSASSISREIYQGSLLYLMGMSYYERQGRFADEAASLTKMQRLGNFAVGLAKLGPRRDSNGAIISGVVDPIWPNVDMFFQQTVAIGNGTARPDSGWDDTIAYQNFSALHAADGSSQEHAILNIFFGKSNSVSTVKLLQRAQITGTNGGVIEINYHNYVQQGERTFGGTKLKNFNPPLWDSVLRYFGSGSGQYTVGWITPGAVSASGGFFSDMAVLILGPGGHIAAIGANQRGAYADKLPDNTVQTTQIDEWEIRVDDDANYRASFQDPTSGAKQTAPQGTALYDVPSNQTSLNNGWFFVNPDQSLEGTLNGQLLNDAGGGTYWGLFDNSYDLGPQGDADVRNGNGPDGTVADPVNTLTGEFYVDEVDLVLPGPMPLVLRRNYGSQNLTANQLGYGWKLNYMPFLTLASNNLIYASEADGSVIVFAKQGTNDLWAPTKDRNPNLNNFTTDGIGSVANRFNARLAKVASNYYLTNADGSLRVFEEKSFALSASIDRLRPYLTFWYDNQGNFFKFEYGTNLHQADWGQVRRISSSSGNVLLFYYDVYGRIQEVYSRDGRRVRYDYDRFGDLRGVFRPDASELQFEYVLKTWTTNSTTNVYSTHLLSREIKPDGRVLKNEYDSLRRVTNQWATVGPDLRLVRNATFRFTNNFSLTNLTATLSGSTTVLDYANNPTSFYYTNGLIRRTVDPLGIGTIQTWFEDNETNAPAYPRSLKSVTDRRGLITEFLYDARGNATNTTLRGDLLGDGNTTTSAGAFATFNDNNLPTARVDAAGNTNLFFYTNTWLLSRVEFWPSNATPAQAITNLYSYYSVSNAADGTVSFGLRQREIRAAHSPDAATNEWAYDSRGFATQLTRHTGTVDPNVTVTQFHNARGELIEQSDALGRKVRYEYDAMGRPVARETFEAGQTIPLAWEYSYRNGNGEVFWSDGPRFDPEDYVWLDYDGNGRLSQQVKFRSRAKLDGSGVEAETGDALYASSFNEYDPFNNLTRSINPRGAITTNTYDALGRLITRKVLETNGSVLTTEGFAYEQGGQVAFHTNALGGISETRYTSTGQPKYQNSANGSLNEWRYYRDGRLHKEIQSNAGYWETTYDNASRRTTRSFNALGNTWRSSVTELDRRGNVVKSIDFDGLVSTNVFDRLDRIKVAAGSALISAAPTNSPGNPAGNVTNIVQQVATYFYDASGQTLVVSNALGETTTTTFDALARPLSIELKGSNGVIVRVSDTLYATNHHSKTIWQGTGDNSIPATIFTDNDGQPILSVNYPTNNVWQYVWQRYDVAGNRTDLREVSRTGSQVTTWATNSWTYDGLNRATSETVRDGAITTFGYNALGNVTNRAMPAGLTWSATYNTAGQVLTEQENGTGGASARSFSYQYYAAGHNWGGLLQSVTDGRGVARSHTYDMDMRLNEISATGPSLEHNQYRFIAYNHWGQVTWIDESRDSTFGPNVSLTRAYDAYANISDEELLTGEYLAVAKQGWNSAGRRTSLDIGTQRLDFGFRADGRLTNVTHGNFRGAYGYTDGGILTNRYSTAREWQANRRDGMGRILEATTRSGIQNVMTETFAWRGDTRLTNYSAARDLQDDFTDTRSYQYAPFSRDLTQETLNVGLSQSVTINYGIDHGNSGRLGVITSASSIGAATNKWGSPSSGGIDGLGRLAQQTNTLARRQATGKARGAGNVSGTLNGRPLRVEYNRANTNGPWKADLDLNPGLNTLTMIAKHPSGQFTTNATSTFTNSLGNVTVTNNYDANGNLATRIHRTASGMLRTETFIWDAYDRLIKETLRDAFTNGYDSLNIYDGLGRRVQCTFTTISSNVIQNVRTIDFRYDPDFEFMQVGFAIDGKQYWLVHGPDLNGTYGGLQGIGGLEAIVEQDTHVTTVLINDFFGNVVATNAYGVTASAQFLANRYSAYGPLEGYQPPTLSLNTPVASSFGWLGKPIEPTGKYDFGTRQYEPTERRFLSYDTIGFAGGNNPFGFCNNNPIYYYDPDGRLGKPVFDELHWAQNSDGSPRRPFRERLAEIVARATGEPYTPAWDPFASRTPSRFQQIGEAITTTAISFAPGAGETMDGYTLIAPDSSRLDRWLSGASLAANAWTAGLLPNYGAVKTSFRQISDAFTGAPTPHTPSMPTPEVVPITDPARLLPAPKYANPDLPGAPIESFQVGPGGLSFPQGRAHGDIPSGSFLSDTPIPNQGFVRDDLATLPEWNPATHVSDAFVPEGVWLQRSTAGPQGSGHGGGASQLRILNRSDVDRVTYSNTRQLAK